jgi:hypothetical protein
MGAASPCPPGGRECSVAGAAPGAPERGLDRVAVGVPPGAVSAGPDGTEAAGVGAVWAALDGSWTLATTTSTTRLIDVDSQSR